MGTLEPDLALVSDVHTRLAEMLWDIHNTNYPDNQISPAQIQVGRTGSSIQIALKDAGEDILSPAILAAQIEGASKTATNITPVTAREFNIKGKHPTAKINYGKLEELALVLNKMTKDQDLRITIPNQKSAG